MSSISALTKKIEPFYEPKATGEGQALGHNTGGITLKQASSSTIPTKLFQFLKSLKIQCDRILSRSRQAQLILSVLRIQMKAPIVFMALQATRKMALVYWPVRKQFTRIQVGQSTSQIVRNSSSTRQRMGERYFRGKQSLKLIHRTMNRSIKLIITITKMPLASSQVLQLDISLTKALEPQREYGFALQSQI